MDFFASSIYFIELNNCFDCICVVSLSAGQGSLDWPAHGQPLTNITSPRRFEMEDTFKKDDTFSLTDERTKVGIHFLGPWVTKVDQGVYICLHISMCICVCVCVFSYIV